MNIWFFVIIIQYSIRLLVKVVEEYVYECKTVQ